MDDYRSERERNRDRLVEVGVRTHVPTKWRLVDLETGDIWRADPDGRLRRASDGYWVSTEGADALQQ